jgi:hypothetical protein
VTSPTRATAQGIAKRRFASSEAPAYARVIASTVSNMTRGNGVNSNQLLPGSDGIATANAPRPR